MAERSEAIDTIKRIHKWIHNGEKTNEGVTVNHKLCARLLNRLADLDTVLSQPEHQKALEDEKALECLKTLLKLCKDAVEYIDRFNKNFTAGVFPFHSMKETFVRIDARLCEAMGALPKYGVSVLDQMTAKTPRDDVEDMLMDKENGVVKIMSDRKNLHLVTWLDANPENNDELIERITSEIHNVLIVQRRSFQEVWTDFMAHRTFVKSASSMWSWRIICNPNHQKVKGGIDETDAYKDLIQNLFTEDIQVPVMVYTEESKVEEINNCLREDDSCSEHPNTCATSLENCLLTYCQCTTLVWIGDCYGDEIGEAIRKIQNKGVVVACWIDCEDSNDEYESAFEWADALLEENHKIIADCDKNLWFLVYIGAPGKDDDEGEDAEEITEKVDLINKLRKEWSCENKVMFYCNDINHMDPFIKESRKLKDVTVSNNLDDVISFGLNTNTKAKTEGSSPNSIQKVEEEQKGKLVISKIIGKSLIACDKRSSNPYIVFEQDGNEIDGAQTTHKKKTLNPKWTKLNIEIECASGDTVNTVCHCWNRFGAEPFMGEAVLSVSDIIEKQTGEGPIECILKLSDPNKRAKKKKPIKSGELTITLKWITGKRSEKSE